MRFFSEPNYQHLRYRREEATTQPKVDSRFFGFLSECDFLWVYRSFKTFPFFLFKDPQNYAPRQHGGGGYGGYGQQQNGWQQQQGVQQFPGFGVQFQVPNYNQLFNQQNQFQNQLLNNFNQLSNQFLTALTGGYGQQQRPPYNNGGQQPPYNNNNGGGYVQPPYNGNGGQPPITHRPTYPTVPTNRPLPPPAPPAPSTDEDLINEIFTKPPTDEESGADLIDIRVDENEGKTRRKRAEAVTEAPKGTEEEVAVDNRFGLGKYRLLTRVHLSSIQNSIKVTPIG